MNHILHSKIAATLCLVLLCYLFSNTILAATHLSHTQTGFHDTLKAEQHSTATARKQIVLGIDKHSVKAFIHNMVQQYNFSEQQLNTIFNKSKFISAVIPSIQHPYEEKPWYIYKNRLVNQKRILLGVDYWQRHDKALRYAEKKYGVPASIIVAIVGIESLYGQAHMKYPVLDTLITLSFAYPPRATFFQDELKHYLLLTRTLNIDPTSIYGSYAGAIGLPQFMPSSYRNFAIAYSDNNKLGDLMNDNDDVVVSIANYLHHFGWQKNEAVAAPAIVNGHKYQKVLSDQLTPIFTIKRLKHYGIKPTCKLPSNIKATLIQLQNSDNYEYWLGLANFYVISHYNNNKQYVMAVYQLALALQHRYYSQTNLQSTPRCKTT